MILKNMKKVNYLTENSEIHNITGLKVIKKINYEKKVGDYNDYRRYEIHSKL